jgi:hypothetical protein
MTARLSFVAELNLVVDAAGATTRLLFGTEGWTTKPTDTPANAHIAGLLADPGSIRSELFSGARLTGPVRPSFGQIVLNNADGALDELMGYGMGGTVTVRYGSVGDAYPAAWTTVFVAYAYALVVDFNEVRVLLRDRLFLLDKPIVTETFAGFGALTGTGIATKKQQMVLGRPGLIPLVLIDQNKQIYWMQGNGASARQWLGSDSADYYVFDGGVPLARGGPYATPEEGLSIEPSPGEFRLFGLGAATDAHYESTGPVYVRLGSPPEFELRAQAVGLLKNGPDNRARPWTFVDLLNRAGINDVTSGNLAPGSTVLTAGNRLIDADQTYIEVMADVAGARFDAFGFDRLDRFFMVNLKLGEEGTDAPVHTFTVHNAKDFRRQPVPGQESPAWQVSVNAGMAWPSQIANSLTAEQADKFQRERQQSFTGTADSVRKANPGAESATLDVVGNEFSTLDQRKAFVRRYFELFGGRRDLISVTARLTPETIAIDLHSKVTIDMPRLGCEGGRDFRVVMSDLNLRARTATFWMWGGAVGPSDALLGGGSSETGSGSIPPGVYEPLVQMGEFITHTAGSAASTGAMEVLMGDFYTITNVDSSGADPYFSSVVLLLHFDGANGSTSIVDSSSWGKTVTCSGLSAISTTESLFGGSSGKGGSNSYFEASLGTEGDFTADFTVEMRVKDGSTTVFFTGPGGTGYLYNDNFQGYGGATLSFAGLGTTAGAIGLPWTHIAISRVGSSIRSFINGTLIDTKTYGGAVDMTTMRFGMFIPNTNLHYLGYYEEIRVTKGVGRYAASFTVPAAAFPNF